MLINQQFIQLVTIHLNLIFPDPSSYVLCLIISQTCIHCNPINPKFFSEQEISLENPSVSINVGQKPAAERV